jgi:hypothetical protein
MEPKGSWLCHKNLPLFAVLSQINPVLAAPPSPHHISSRSILIWSPYLHLHLRSGPLSSGFTTKTVSAHLFSYICVTCPAHFILLAWIITVFGEEYRSQSSLLCKLLQSPVASSSPTHLLQLPVVENPQLMFLHQSERPSFKLIHRAWKITVLYLLINDSKLKDKIFWTKW